MSNNTLATALVVPLEQLRMTDVEAVGGKNASLGEMISQLAGSGVRVPGGFATTAHAFRTFLSHDGLAGRIAKRLADLDADDVRALAEAGAQIRGWIEETPFPPAFEAAIRAEFEKLVAGQPDASFAVRSSATAEDLPDASFAGQQETFLNVVGIDAVLARTGRSGAGGPVAIAFAAARPGGREAQVFCHHGAFPCQTTHWRPPWSYRLNN